MTPLDFTLSVQDFDVYLLPEDSRDIHSPQFHTAVAQFYADQFAPMGGTAVVGFDGDTIHVSWMPDGASQQPLAYAISLLQSGQFKEAVPILSVLLDADPLNVDILFNLGMAESDLGHLDKAIGLLERAVELDPDHSNAWAALGIAYQRKGKSEQALSATERAVQINPENGVAQRNLGSLLGMADLHKEAELHLRAAVRLMPNDQTTLFSLAHLLEEIGGEEQLNEADQFYQQVIAINPESDLGEDAMTASRKLAQKTFRNRGVPIRMDAVQYCLAAMQKFAGMDRQQVQSIAFEAAMLGRNGLDVNNPATRYTLKSWPGDYSGLHLLSIMYVGFKQISPNSDLGFDLAQEYALAKQMFSDET